MSKRSQDEARQMRDEQEQQRHSKFLETLAVYLKMFGECLPRSKELGSLSETGITGYDVALRHLSSQELKLACEECLRGEWFPSPGEVLNALDRARRNIVTAGYGHSPAVKDLEVEPISAEQMEEIKAEFAELAQKLSMDEVLKRERKVKVEVELRSSHEGPGLIPTVNGRPLAEWAGNQDLNDGLPRTKQEIEFIKQAKGYKKQKGNRGRYEQRGL